MENTHENEQMEQPQDGYVPRPAWQVWCARVALVLFILLVIGQVLNMARGGL